jgi:hypothetical protein
VYPSGEVQYLHPKDGVYPEKLNKGRVGVNNNMRSIGKNPNPATVRVLAAKEATSWLRFLCCTPSDAVCLACTPFADQVRRQAGPVRGVNDASSQRDTRCSARAKSSKM